MMQSFSNYLHKIPSPGILASFVLRFSTFQVPGMLKYGVIERGGSHWLRLYSRSGMLNPSIVIDCSISKSNKVDHLAYNTSKERSLREDYRKLLDHSALCMHLFLSSRRSSYPKIYAAKSHIIFLLPTLS